MTSGRPVHVLLPDASGRRVLATAQEPVLPSFRLDLADEETTLVRAIAALRDRFGMTSPVLELLVVGSHDDPDAALLVLEDDPDFQPPATLAWHDLAAGDPRAPAAVRARAAQWLREWRTGAPPPELRPRWARPGWFGRASAWLTAVLAERGRAPSGDVEQIFAWGISSVLRVPTGGGPAWFKASFPPFHHEPAMTELLSASFPDRVPGVLATEPREGWLVLDDFGPTVVRDARDGPGWIEGPRALTTIQRGLRDRTADLVATGAPQRPLPWVREAFRELLAASPPIPGMTFSRGESAAALTRVERAVAAVAGLGIGDTVVHGDFHPGNVTTAGGRPIVFDWSDAAVGHPLLDVVTWIESDDPASRAELYEPFVEAWSDEVAPARLRAAFADVIVVGAAYQAIAYADILRNLEPAHHPSLAGGLELFLGQTLG